MNMSKFRSAKIPTLIGSILLVAMTYVASPASAEVTRAEAELNLSLFVECLGEDITAHWFEDQLIVVQETRNRLHINVTRTQRGEIVSTSGLEWLFLGSRHVNRFIPLDGTDSGRTFTVLDHTIAHARGHSVGNLRFELTRTDQFNALGELVHSVSGELEVTCLP